MVFLNRALYERRLRTNPDMPCDIRPGSIDLVSALDLAKSPSAPTILPLSRSELDVWEDHFKLYIGDQGMLSYDPPHIQGTIQDVCNHRGTY